MGRKAIIDLSFTLECGGSLLANVIFSQCWHYQFRVMKGQPFYKFTAPCKHPLYKKGDSWTEELCCSQREFNYAISKISWRNGSQKPKQDALIWIESRPGAPSVYQVNVEKSRKCLLSCLNESTSI